MKCFKANVCPILLTLQHTETDLCAFVTDKFHPKFLKLRMAFKREKRLVLFQRLNDLQINRALLFQSLFLNFIIHIFQKYFVFLKAGRAKTHIFHSKVW